MNVSFSLTARGRILSWRLDLEEQPEQSRHGSGGYLGAQLDAADAETLDGDQEPFGFTTPAATQPGTPSPDPA